MKRPPVARLLSIVVPIVAMVSYGATTNAADDPHSPNALRNQTAESDYELVLVGTQTYRIPKSHLLYVRKDSTGKVLRVIMDAELPLLNPLPSSGVLPRERIYNRITIHIEARPRHYAGFLKRKGTFLKESGVLFDLRQYTLFGEPHSYVPLDKDYGSPIGEQIAFACSGEGPSKEFPLASPICQTGYATNSDGTGIYYRFYQKHLQDWREIDAAVRSFVESLKQ